MSKNAYQQAAHPLFQNRPVNDQEWREFIRLLLDGPLKNFDMQGRVTVDPLPLQPPEVP